jgi:hypothetical protein
MTRPRAWRRALIFVVALLVTVAGVLLALSSAGEI